MELPPRHKIQILAPKKMHSAIKLFIVISTFLFFKAGHAQEPKSVHPVKADAQTDPMPDDEDAADDAALWINYENPAGSFIVGTNKQRGLYVYDLSGNYVSDIPAGRINNIDIRHSFLMADGYVIPILAGSNRTNNTLGLYTISTDGELKTVHARDLKSKLREVYGICLYRSPITKKVYAFLNGKSGKIEQWELFPTAEGKVDGNVVRKIRVRTQPEGCVCDDEKGYLYLGEENKGIWKFSASPTGGSTAHQVADLSNPNLSADIEGLTLYLSRDGSGYLLASSQGNNTFAVFTREGSNKYLGSFEIVPGENIDGASDTDGIEVTNVGLGNAFPDGLFIAQDGYNVMNGDTVNQNFKLVSWKKIAESFQPELIIENAYRSESNETTELAGE